MRVDETIREKMEGFGVAEAAILAFERAYGQLVSGGSGLIDEGGIEPASGIAFYEDLEEVGDYDAELLGKTALIKLNGGLGTSMGLQKVKSLLRVKGEKTFLDLIARQVLYLRERSGAEVRFLLMNSHASSGDTLRYLSEVAPELGGAEEIEMMQNWAPKLRADDFKPVSWEENRALEWCPPGHGDVYPALVGSGWLDQLLEEGVRYAFVSNSDNLGAVMDATLLSYFAKSNAPFLMEVTERTEADRKGGHLARRRSDGRFILREVAQCAAEDMEQFQDIGRHRFFNTNNLWINLEAVKEVMEGCDGVMPLPVIRNQKTVDPRDGSTTPVVHLEVAMGAAIESFEGAEAVCVPRSRFAPVKSTADLLALRSDAYEELENGCLALAGVRGGKPPVVRLSEEYRLVDGLDGLGVPSLIGAAEVDVEGVMSFEKGVEVMGSVIFRNEREEGVLVPPRVYRDEVWEG